MSDMTPPPPPPGFPPSGPPPGFPPSGPPPGYTPYGGGMGPAENSKKALWAMILGILSLVCCGIFTGIPAIVLGKMGQNEIDASGGRLTGRGMATAGFVLGIISIPLSILGVLINVSNM